MRLAFLFAGTIFKVERSLRRVPGLAILLGKSCQKKNVGQFKKISRKSRNRCGVNSGVVGARGQLTPGPDVPSPGIKYKRTKIVFIVVIIALKLVHIWTRLLELPSQSLIGSPVSLSGPYKSQSGYEKRRMQKYTH